MLRDIQADSASRLPDPRRHMVCGLSFGRPDLCRAMLLDAAKPFGDERLDEVTLLVRQRVPGAVQHRECAAGIVLDQIPMACESH